MPLDPDMSFRKNEIWLSSIVLPINRWVNTWPEGEPLMFIVPPAKRGRANTHTVWALER